MKKYTCLLIGVCFIFLCSLVSAEEIESVTIQPLSDEKHKALTVDSVVDSGDVFGKIRQCVAKRTKDFQQIAPFSKRARVEV